MRGIGAYNTSPKTINLPVNTHGVINVTGNIGPTGVLTNYTTMQWTHYNTGAIYISHYDVLYGWTKWKEIVTR